MKIYIAGPMTNIKYFNAPAFLAAAKYLREEGHEVFSPCEHNTETLGPDWEFRSSIGDPKVLSAFNLRQSFKVELNWICDNADAMFMLIGWENSKGARCEHALAILLGLKLIYQEDTID
jgi:uncharacterized protein DUF4406